MYSYIAWVWQTFLWFYGSLWPRVCLNGSIMSSLEDTNSLNSSPTAHPPSKVYHTQNLVSKSEQTYVGNGSSERFDAARFYEVQ